MKFLQQMKTIVMSLLMSLCVVHFPRDVLNEIRDLFFFPTYLLGVPKLYWIPTLHIRIHINNDILLVRLSAQPSLSHRFLHES